jgi:glycosyltransferase involved in cell wall biosynthesis
MRDQTAATPRYSLVVPFHNEQESVVELHRQLSDVMTGKFEPVEFIYVDDQSSDATPQLLAKIAQEDPRVAILRLKRNYGQTTALAAGFDFASGDIVISMDGDLQHDPAEIPMMLETSAGGARSAWTITSCGGCRRGWRTG